MWRRALVFIILLLLAIGGNLLNVPLLFGSVHVIFGGIFAFVALELLGFVPALVIATALSAHLFFLWGHPWGSVLFLGEFLVVALLYRKKGLELIVADWIFWFLIGIPAYVIGLKYILEVNSYALYLPFKGAVNGLLNVSLASLILLLIYLFLFKDRKISFRRMVMVSMMVLSTLPLFAKTLYDISHEEEIILNDVKEDLQRVSKYAELQLIYWLKVHLSAVETLADALESWGKENVEELQRQTEAVRKAFRDFHACYIADEGATTLTFYPQVNPAGRYMVGINFNYRPYYKKVKKTLKPVFTEVFIAKFALQPVVGIAVPAIKNGKFIGFAYCGLNLKHARKLLRNLSTGSGIYMTLVDKNGKVIASSSHEYEAFKEFKLRRFHVLEEGVVIHLLEEEKGVPLKRWRHAHFFYSDVIGKNVNWKLITEAEVSPYREELLAVLGQHFIVIYFLGAISLLFSGALSKRIYDPIKQLDEAVKDLADRIEASPKLQLPKSNISLIDSLMESFRNLAEKIITYTRELRNMAYYDTLTGLPNRVLLMDRIRQAIAFSSRHNKRVAVMFIDLDNFKHINDTYGHEVGDTLLIQVANRLSAVFRETDTVARFGGDEFIAVIPEVSDISDITKLADRVLRVLERPFEIDGEELFLSASIGISLYPDNGQDASSLIKFADAAMYKAKEEGKNKFALFTKELHEKSIDIFVMKNRLHRALEKEEFLLYYQPIHELKTKELIGCEALLRWKHPTKGVLSPAAFMEHLEEMGIIKDVGEWVFREACEKAKEWNLGIHVNISPKQFMFKDLITFLDETLKAKGVNPSLLSLEITEGTFIRNKEEAINLLWKVKNLGMRVFLDDFGTGYSSLLYVKSLPIDGLKIDRYFVNSIERSKVDRTIVRFTIELAHSLGMIAIAEGVEEEFQLMYMKELGCDAAQGYYFSKPLPEEEFRAYLKRFKK